MRRDKWIVHGAVSSHIGKNAVVYHSSIHFFGSSVGLTLYFASCFALFNFFSLRSVNCNKSRTARCNESLVGLGLPFFPLCMDSSSVSHCSAVDLLALLKWKAYPDRVMDILGRLRHVSGEEIVKVLHEITHLDVIANSLRPGIHF